MPRGGQHPHPLRRLLQSPSPKAKGGNDENNIGVAIPCSPHNPCGRVWERWELERAAEVFAEHGTVVIADEIWSDLVWDGNRHIPFFCTGDYARMHTVTPSSPSKTFNLSGLIGSYDIVFDEPEHALWDVGVTVQDGRMFGGTCHIRMNVAIPTHKLEEALGRMARVLRG